MQIEMLIAVLLKLQSEQNAKIFHLLLYRAYKCQQSQRSGTLDLVDEDAELFLIFLSNLYSCVGCR